MKEGDCFENPKCCCFDACYGDDCRSLSNVVLPKSISNIDYDAFALCDSITIVDFYGGLDDWDNVSVGPENECLTEKVHTNNGNNGNNK